MAIDSILFIQMERVPSHSTDIWLPFSTRFCVGLEVAASCFSDHIIPFPRRTLLSRITSMALNIPPYHICFCLNSTVLQNKIRIPWKPWFSSGLGHSYRVPAVCQALHSHFRTSPFYRHISPAAMWKPWAQFQGLALLFDQTFGASVSLCIEWRW